MTHPTPSIGRGRPAAIDQVGTVAVAQGLSHIEHGGAGAVRTTEFILSGVSVAIADDAGVGQYGSQKLYDAPEGAILHLGAVSDLDVTAVAPTIATWEGDVGVGTTAVTDGNALATTEQNIIPTTAIPAAVALVTTANAQSTATQNAVIDGTTTASDWYLNLRVDDNAAHTASTLTVSGRIYVHYIVLGDY